MNRLLEGKGFSFSFHLFLFLFLALLQYLLFRTYVQREIAIGYPVNHDQSYYLVVSYQLHDSILKNGFLNALRQYLFKEPQPSGFLLPLDAALLYLFFGASRLTALTVNFLHFVAFQFIFWLVLKKWSGHWTMAWIGWGLLLSFKTTFFYAGGMDDFRLDFSAFCLYGIYLTLVMHSKVFLSLHWSLTAALSGILLIFTRYFTVLYIFGFLAILISALFILLQLKKINPEQARRRLKNILLTGGLCMVVSSPALWISRQAIYDYYVVGHIVGAEKKIRAKEVGVLNWKDHLKYYPHSLISHHAGKIPTLIFGVLVLAWVIRKIIASNFQKGLENKEQWQEEIPIREEFLCAFFAFLVPFFILTLNQAKSPVVGNILLPSFLWLTLLVLFPLWGGVSSGRKQWQKLLCVVVVMVAASNNQINGYCREGPFRFRKNDAKEIGKMYQEISDYCVKTENFYPHFLTNHLADYLGARIFMIEAYERSGLNLRVSGRLGHSIFSFSKDEAWKHIEESDIVVLSDTLPQNPPPYPFYQSMSELMDEIEKKVISEFVLLGDYHLTNHRLQAFVKPTYRITGVASDGWIMDSGTTLFVPKIAAEKASALEFTADYVSHYFPSGLQIEAHQLLPGGRKRKLNVQLKLSEKMALVRVELPAESLLSGHSEDLQIQLLFSDYFIPKELGINPDERRLVLQNPKNRKMLFKRKS